MLPNGTGTRGATLWTVPTWSFLALSAIIASACSSPADNRVRPDDPEEPPPPDTVSLRVLVLGDWGKRGDGPAELAQAIAATHAESPPDLVLTVGDNIYPHGVEDAHDPLWERRFVEVYRGPFWDSLVFHPSLGNHDHDENPDGQVEYSNVNPRWSMPSRHYLLRRPVGLSDSALFVALDTDPIEDSTPASADQVAWADSVVEHSGDRWILVYGHHPVASGGRHSVHRDYLDTMLPVLENQVDLFLAGHNHSLELLETPWGFPAAVCGGGSGRESFYEVEMTPLTLKAFTEGGWCFLRIWTDSMAIELYDRHGAQQYRHLVEKGGF
jgi:tartrate-resistant acid phosphatase type 5